MDWSHQAIEYTGWMDTCSGVIQKVTNALKLKQKITLLN